MDQLVRVRAIRAVRHLPPVPTPDTFLRLKVDDMNSVVARLIRTLLATLVATLGALICLSPAPAHADGGTIGVSITPASATGRDSRTRFSYKVDPGQKVGDHVMVSNVGTKKLTVTLFATDAFNTEDGSYALLETSAKATGAGSWTTFEGSKRKVTITLAPQKSQIVPFTVRVPANALPGDHPAGIVASASAAGDGQLNVERRIASRLYVRVSGDLQPALTVSSFAGEYHSGLNPLDGTVTVTAVIRNSGNVALGGNVSLKATTWFGAEVGAPVETELIELLPGNTRTVSLQLTGVPQVGFVQPHLQLVTSVAADAPDPGPLPVVQRDTFLLAVPWIGIAVIALAVAVWLFLRWRRKRDARRAAEWIAYTESEALRKAQEGRNGSPDADTSASASAADPASDGAGVKTSDSADSGGDIQ